MGDNRDGLYIQTDSNDDYGGSAIKLFESNKYYNSISYPIIVTEGLTVCASSVGYKKYITGYLR